MPLNGLLEQCLNNVQRKKHKSWGGTMSCPEWPSWAVPKQCLKVLHKEHAIGRDCLMNQRANNTFLTTSELLQSISCLAAVFSISGNILPWTAFWSYINYVFQICIACLVWIIVHGRRVLHLVSSNVSWQTYISIQYTIGFYSILNVFSWEV